MCEAITLKGEICKNKVSKNSKDKYCLLHKKLLNLNYKQKEVSALNKTVQRKNKEIKDLHFTIIENNNTIQELKNDLESMREDFEKYQFIKKFEIIKGKIKKLVGSNVLKNPYLLQQYMSSDTISSELKTILNCDDTSVSFYEIYDFMRLKRNAYCHKFQQN